MTITELPTQPTPSRSEADHRLLAGKRLVITGVVTKDSIAFEVARQAQEAGAEIVLTGFGRAKRMTERAAARLPEPVDVLDLDVNDEDDLAAIAAELDAH
jgi:meromycolic acid enoyl-[acyl-carrier-protein] reductase